MELRALGTLRHVEGRQIDPNEGDLALNARWGILQQGQYGPVVMPGPGQVSDADDSALSNHPLGPGGHDVRLNSSVFWHAVPKPVWEFTIGGYQVIKKWLSYRERPILGRDLSLDEARFVTGMIRRLAAILLIGPDLDEAYRTAAGSHVPSKP
jgi:hypothetical protein